MRVTLRVLTILGFLFISTLGYARVTDMSSRSPLAGKTYLFEQVVDGAKRKFIVHVPAKYTGQKKVPLVFMFHGSGGTGIKFFKMSKWAETGEKYGFITVFPYALRTCVEIDKKRSTKTYWMTPTKAASVCTGSAQDDVKFVDFMLSEVKKHYKINSRRIYSSGFSNGLGFTLTRMLGERSNVFAAVGGSGSSIRDPLTLSHEPITTVVLMGQIDSRFEEHIPFPMNASGYNGHGMLTSSTGHLTTALKLSTAHTFSRKLGGKVFLATYETPTSTYRDHRFIMGIMKNIDHKWPNGTGSTRGIVAAEYLWGVFSKIRK